MKLFGHYLFEDQPELRAWKMHKAIQEREQMIASCEGKDSWPLLDCDLVADIYDSNAPFTAHVDQQTKQYCHIFDSKKYCYHTGGEIITQQ